MFNRIIITNLFGNFNYDITLKSGGVTIITGPNGFGKSTILRSIDALYRGDIIFFSKLDFSEIHFIGSEQDELIIKKNNDKLFFNGTEFDDKSTPDMDLSQLAINDQFLLKKIGENSIMDKLVEDLLDIDKLMIKYNLNSCKNEKNGQHRKLTKVKKMMVKTSGETRFIKEQRLITEKLVRRVGGLNDKKFVNIIDDLPDSFKEIMNKISNEYSATANKLDSTYPNRLFETGEGISKEEYLKKMLSMSERFTKLAKFNISDIKLHKDVDFLDEHAKALKVYFEDFDKKYEVFDEFIIQLEMFTKIVNSRLKFKNIQISRENGIEVFKENNSEKPLSLNQLSSGEKQEIILFYELIFQIDKDVHLLIDEPEISLHIEWQLKFMDDLLKIAEYKNLKVTVATHSPQIINNHWDIQIDLGELYGN